jgi:hypothetical protein
LAAPDPALPEEDPELGAPLEDEPDPVAPLPDPEDDVLPDPVFDEPDPLPPEPLPEPFDDPELPLVEFPELAVPAGGCVEEQSKPTSPMATDRKGNTYREESLTIETSCTVRRVIVTGAISEFGWSLSPGPVRVKPIRSYEPRSHEGRGGPGR